MKYAAALFVTSIASLQSLGVGFAQTACNAPALPLAGTRVVNVATEPALQAAMNNLQPGDTVLIADGTYNLTSSLYINGKDNVTIRGTSGCTGVVLAGKGMDTSSASVPFGIWSNSRNTTIAHLTIRDTWDNEIMFNSGAQAPHVYSVKLLNAGSQFIKSNPTDATMGIGVNNGLVEYSWLEYTNGPPGDHGGGAGYTNGISAHAADDWIIRGNVFKNFHTPDSATYLWNPAVLMWNHSANTLTERNTFINVDRSIAYGLQLNPPGNDHSGGTIRNNFVYLQPGLMSAARKASSDGTMIVWDSPNTKVYHNTVLANANIFYSIEFRFSTTTNGEARNNLADLPIHVRDGAGVTQSGNLGTATSGMFVDPASANLHLQGTATAAIDQAPFLAAVRDDFDGESRPQAPAYDIGADEFLGPANTPTPGSTPTNTPTRTPTNNPTHTPTSIPTKTPTNTSTATRTPTSTPAAPPTHTPTPTSTPVPTATPGKEVCRGPSFWAAHARFDPTQPRSRNIASAAILAGGGCLNICGEVIVPTGSHSSSTDCSSTGNNFNCPRIVNDADSAEEALCAAPTGDKRLQLVRHLTAAALNCSVTTGSRDCTGTSGEEAFKSCNAACANGLTSASIDGHPPVDCVRALNCFNKGGQFDSVTGKKCRLGTCSTNDAQACGPGFPACPGGGGCVPAVGNCSQAVFGACSDAPADGNPAVLCSSLIDPGTGLGTCKNGSTCVPGPSGSSSQCNSAIANSCTVVPPGETSCTAGNTCPDSEDCCDPAGPCPMCLNGDTCTSTCL